MIIDDHDPDSCMQLRSETPKIIHTHPSSVRKSTDVKARSARRVRAGNGAGSPVCGSSFDPSVIGDYVILPVDASRTYRRGGWKSIFQPGPTSIVAAGTRRAS